MKRSIQILSERNARNAKLVQGLARRWLMTHDVRAFWRNWDLSWSLLDCLWEHLADDKLSIEADRLGNAIIHAAQVQGWIYQEIPRGYETKKKEG